MGTHWWWGRERGGGEAEQSGKNPLPPPFSGLKREGGSQGGGFEQGCWQWGGEGFSGGVGVCCH